MSSLTAPEEEPRPMTTDQPMRAADTPEREPAPHYPRHRDDEWVDEIRMVTVPRFKESGLSGAEWRTSVRVDYLRKGVVVRTESYGRLTWAIAHIAKHAVGLHPGDFPHDGLSITDEEYRALDEDRCMQPGCPEPWTVEYRQTLSACDRCGKTREHAYQPAHRRFCDRHKTRGDSALDDMDDRYEHVR